MRDNKTTQDDNSLPYLIHSLLHEYKYLRWTFLPLETEDTVEDECKKSSKQFYFFHDEKGNFVQIARNLLTTGDPLVIGINRCEFRKPLENNKEYMIMYYVYLLTCVRYSKIES